MKKRGFGQSKEIKVEVHAPKLPEQVEKKGGEAFVVDLQTPIKDYSPRKP